MAECYSTRVILKSRGTCTVTVITPSFNTMVMENCAVSTLPGLKSV